MSAPSAPIKCRCGRSSNGTHPAGSIGSDGEPDRPGLHELRQAATGLHQWTLDEDAAAPFFRQAVELGVTFWDTANVYQGGTSEEFVGRAIKRFSRREDIVLATKVCGKMHDGPGGSGLSRKAILEQAGRVAAAAGHRLHRRLLHPPFR